MDIKIREMQPQDVAAVTALEESCFSMPWKRHDFEEILTNPDRIYLVAESDNRIIGGCMLTMITGEGDVSNVAVNEAYRGQHIATALIQELLYYGEEKGIADFTLEVREQNHIAIRLYESVGFVSEGIRPNFYDKPKDNAVIMWRRKKISERI